MSKGLGKVERFILDALKGGSCIVRENGYVFMSDLAYHLQKDRNGDEPDLIGDITRSCYVAVARAVSNLEGKGMVNIEVKYPGWLKAHRDVGKRGGESRRKSVRLSVDTKGKSGLVSTLTEKGNKEFGGD